MIMTSGCKRLLLAAPVVLAACAAQNRMGDVEYWSGPPPAHIRPLYDTLDYLVREQLAFHAANGFYHESVGELDVTTPEGTTVGVEANEGGWSAVARSPEGAECAVFLGRPRTIPAALGVPVAREQRIVCAQRAGLSAGD